MNKQHKIDAINDVVIQFFKSNPNISKVAAKDLMPQFIKANIFSNDHKNGLPLRNLLRELDSAKQLNLIPTLLAERKQTNTYWYFIRPGIKIINTPKTTNQIKPKLKKQIKSSNRDEVYVINLCDEVLGLKSSRQHKFEFLKGDAKTKLPVDAYYEELKLVIEFREKQHTESVKHFDKPDKMTVSGVNRGEQRKIYDQRRRDVLPKHGIKLVEISYSDFDYDSSKKIIRNNKDDLLEIKNLLQKRGVL